MPRGPLGATSICTIAIGLIASASANIVVGMNVGDLGVHRMFWTLSGALLGGLAIYVFKCHSMLAPGTEK